MKIYTVIWKDRHSDTTAKPFLDLDEAIAYARKSAVKILKRPENYKESSILGWEFYATYSGEGGYIWITKDEVALTIPQPIVKSAEEMGTYEEEFAEWEQGLYKQAMSLWGPESQRLMLAEECSELAAAVHHFKRNKICIDDLCEEIADVEIMIGQMRVMYATMINDIKFNKLKRLENNLKKD